MTAQGSTLPPITARIAFGNNPLTVAPTWTDVSTLLRSVTIDRGRQHELSSFEPGRCDLVFNGNSGELDPFNTASPYYPNVANNKQIQVCATFNQLTQAQSLFAASSWPVATNVTPTYSAGTFTNCLQSIGSLTMVPTVSGTTMSQATPAGTSGFALQQNQQYTFAATLKVASGGTPRSCTLTLTCYDASGNTLQSFTVTQNDALYAGVNFFSTVTTPAGTAYGQLMATVTAPAENHVLSNAAVYWGGVPSAQLNNLMTSAVGSIPGGPVPLFTGFIDGIAPKWKGNLQTDIEITATDILRLAADTDMPADLAVGAALVFGAQNCYPFGDTAGTQAADVIGQRYSRYGPGNVFGTATWGAAARNATSGLTTLALNPGTVGVATIPATTGSWQVSGWFKTTQTNQGLYYQGTPGNFPGIAVHIYADIDLHIDASGHLVFMMAGTTLITYTGLNVSDGNWHIVTFGYDSFNGLYYLYTDSDLGTNVVNANIPIPSSSTQAYIGLTYESGAPTTSLVGSLSCWAIWPSAPSSAIPGSAKYLYTFGSAGFDATQTSLQRAWSAAGIANQDFATFAQLTTGVHSPTGHSAIQAPTAPLTGTSLLSYLQSLSAAEYGAIYADVWGNVVGHDRWFFSKLTGVASSVCTFGDSSTAGEVPYTAMDVGYDNQDFFNGSSVTRSGGTTQIVAPSSASSQQYGVNRYLVESGLLIESDAESLNRAQYNQQRYGSPKARVRRVDVDVTSPTAQANGVLFGIASAASLSSPLNTQVYAGADLGEPVTVNRRPYSAAPSYQPTILADSPSLYYRLNDATVNLMPALNDANFSSGTVGSWASMGNAAVAADTTAGAVDGKSVDVTCNVAGPTTWGGGPVGGANGVEYIPVTNLQSYTVSMYVALASGTGRVATCRIIWYTSSGTQVGTSAQSAAVTATSAYQRISVTIPAASVPATAAYGVPEVLGANGVNGDGIRVSNVQFEIGSLTAYSDPTFTVADSSTSANTGTIHGGVEEVSPGAVSGGGAMLLDGGTGYVKTNSALPGAVPGVSIEAWVYVTSSAATDKIVLYGSNYLQLDTLNRPYFGMSDGTTMFGANGLSLNTWHYLVATWDGTTGIIYVDGAAVQTAANSGAPTWGSASAYVGSYNGTSSFFPGQLAEVAVYSTALSAARITAHYNARNPGAFPASPTLSQVSMVEGVRHQIDLGTRKWQASWMLAPADVTDYWLLDTSALGTGTILAY